MRRLPMSEPRHHRCHRQRPADPPHPDCPLRKPRYGSLDGINSRIARIRCARLYVDAADRVFAVQSGKPGNVILTASPTPGVSLNAVIATLTISCFSESSTTSIGIVALEALGFNGNRNLAAVGLLIQNCRCGSRCFRFLRCFWRCRGAWRRSCVAG